LRNEAEETAAEQRPLKVEKSERKSPENCKAEMLKRDRQRKARETTVDKSTIARRNEVAATQAIRTLKQSPNPAQLAAFARTRDPSSPRERSIA
jgi:hypothetical protein